MPFNLSPKEHVVDACCVMMKRIAEAAHRLGRAKRSEWRWPGGRCTRGTSLICRSVLPCSWQQVLFANCLQPPSALLVPSGGQQCQALDPSRRPSMVESSPAPVSS
jgi:hypothetical protein